MPCLSTDAIPHAPQRQTERMSQGGNERKAMFRTRPGSDNQIHRRNAQKPNHMQEHIFQRFDRRLPHNFWAVKLGKKSSHAQRYKCPKRTPPGAYANLWAARPRKLILYTDGCPRFPRRRGGGQEGGKGPSGPAECLWHAPCRCVVGPHENTILNGLRADAGLEDSGTKVNEFDGESVRIRRS